MAGERKGGWVGKKVAALANPACSVLDLTLQLAGSLLRNLHGKRRKAMRGGGSAQAQGSVSLKKFFTLDKYSKKCLRFFIFFCCGSKA